MDMTMIGKPIYNDGSVPYIPKKETKTSSTRTGVISKEARKMISGNPYQVNK